MAQIFESPDGGKTIYSRLPGSSARDLFASHPTSPLSRRRYLWEDILREADTNPTLNELVDKAEMVYALIKKEV